MSFGEPPQQACWAITMLQCRLRASLYSRAKAETEDFIPELLSDIQKKATVSDHLLEAETEDFMTELLLEVQKKDTVSEDPPEAEKEDFISELPPGTDGKDRG